MSYILDAVKKAEAERDREREHGAVPTLNARQAAGSNYSANPQTQGPLRVATMAAGVALVVLAVAAALWAWRSGDKAAETKIAAAVLPPRDLAPPAALAAAPVILPIVPPVAPQAAAPVAPPIAATAVPPSATPFTRPATLVAPAAKLEPPAVKTSPAVVVDSIAKPVPQAVPQKPAPVTSPVAVAAPVPSPAPAPPTPSPQAAPPTPVRSASGGIPGLNELPEDIRRQIPALNISGAAYSESTKEWVLLINDQVRAKGSQVNSDLRVEEIGDTSAIFNFRGQRFRIDR